VTVRLRPDLFPNKRPEECEESDPIANLLATLAAGNNDPTVSRLQLRVQPLPSCCLRVWVGKHLVRVLDRPLFRSHDLLADLFKTLASRFTVVRMAALGIGLFIP
jgi:hypothetical protein